MKSFARQVVAACLLAVGSGSLVFGQQIGGADREKRGGDDAPCYRIRHVTYTSPEVPREIVIVISLDPKHFVKEDMMALAYDLRKLYVSESRYGAIILDDDEAALHTSPLHRKDEYLRARRAFYFRNRSTGEEYIQFSTERGKPWTEVKINLSQPLNSSVK
jgi:hypothetical protein